MAPPLSDSIAYPGRWARWALFSLIMIGLVACTDQSPTQLLDIRPQFTEMPDCPSGWSGPFQWRCDRFQDAWSLVAENEVEGCPEQGGRYEESLNPIVGGTTAAYDAEIIWDEGWISSFVISTYFWNRIDDLSPEAQALEFAKLIVHEGAHVQFGPNGTKADREAFAYYWESRCFSAS